MLNSKISKAVRLALAFGSASTVAFATQVQAEEEGAKEVERIQVTGSRISRTDMETATPVTVFTAVEIEKTGVSTVAEFLRNSAASGGFNESQTLNQSAGASSIGLRGFDSSYTLVLLNGRRIAKNSAGGVFTDVNQIPMSAVERIDVLPDGASAVYGSDAVAGVVNVITKKDYQGVEAKAKYGLATEHRDGDELQFSLTAGASSDKTNILFALDYFERRPIMAKDREMGGTAFIEGQEGGEGRSNYGVPGFLGLNAGSAPDSGDDKVWADCPESNSRANGRCAYDFAPLYTFQPQSDRQSIMTTITHQWSDNLTLDSQFRYSRAYTLSSNAPAPGQADVSQSPYLKDFLMNDRYKDNPELGAKIADEIANGTKYIDEDGNEQTASAYVGRRYLDFPNREKDNTNETFEAVVGFEYLINDDWVVDYDLGFARLTNRQIGKRGQLLRNELAAAFNDGTLNPFKINDCNSAELKDFCDGLQTAIHRTSEYEVSFSSATLSGLTNWELPGGVVGIAAGVDYRRESYLDRSDPASVANQVIGSASSNGGGFMKNEAVFMELSLPVIEDLELSLAARQDKADWGVDDASESTYSVKASYRVLDSLMLRASWGTGFKAPGLDDLYTATSEGVRNGVVDTKLCNAARAAGNPDSSDCNGTEINSKSGGNINLQPETSDSYNIGVVWDVTDELALTVDYWSLEIENIIDELSVQDILAAEAVGDPAVAGLVVRNSSGRLDDGLRQGYVQSNYQNLSSADAKGINYNLTYATELSFGALSTNLRFEQYLEQNRQSNAVQPLCDQTGKRTVDAEYEFRLNLGATLETGDFTTSVNVRYLPGYDQYDRFDTENKTCNAIGHYDVETEIDPETSATTYLDYGRPQKIDDYIEFDVTTAYHINDKNKVTVGIRNLFDEQPPFSQVDDWPFYDQDVYNNIGRFLYVQYDIKF
ncbi:TonB-dependent receptor [Pseudoalteromonas sp. DL2-H2.2]|uniref:TonB-dependent receptor plug domain-containing protein n=1 Tax=Pseudoalteromonas sp. DL2-H2.2 TaxID=2908889 RepID=UPI001F329DA4|nr:TonB-dependent receptor [Pseudoalteromonas sp. DL2-H2.2]MCF2907878.1 TonB-dependent receptor [Pseudoalteromonas sp. DL2-H2.2]